jgi:hypothetical protein
MVLSEWKAHWSQDPTWRPWDKNIHGKHHRVFSDAEEAEVADLIVNEFTALKKEFIGATFQELTLAAYMSMGRDSSAFKCCQHFINDFKRQHGFSSRRFYTRRRNQHVNRGILLSRLRTS